jgi:hypothetical protein
MESSEMGLEAERRTSMDPDRLETTVAVEETAVPDRDACLVLQDDCAVKPREGRPRSPPRDPA